jgi:hypothetical protein
VLVQSPFTKGALLSSRNPCQLPWLSDPSLAGMLPVRAGQRPPKTPMKHGKTSPHDGRDQEAVRNQLISDVYFTSLSFTYSNVVLFTETFYIDPQIPSLSLGKKKCRNHHVSDTSFQLHKGPISLELEMMESISRTQRATMNATTHSGDVSLNLVHQYQLLTSDGKG